MSLNVTSLWPSPTSSITATATTASESGPGIQTASSATADLDLVERRLFWSKVAGIGMVFLSGTLIGASVVFTRRSQKRAIGLSGKPSWHSFYWWIGASLMTFGEICNFCAYGLVPAINITPLGAWSVVVSAVLSHIFLKERLDYTGKIGCALCVIGSIIIAVHAPQTFSTRTVRSFFAQASHPVFLSYSSLMLLITVALIFYLGPRFGTAYPLVYVFTGSIFGSFLVLSAQGFGAALAHSVVNWSNDNQFLLWPFYAIFVFEIVMIVCQLYYLNKGVAAFSSTVVAPLYYITFTTVTFLSTIFFFRGFPVDSAVTGITIWFGFFVIAGGVTLL
ncbi:magnesium transporter, partial [Zopfochytrium polystomum]